MGSKGTERAWERFQQPGELEKCGRAVAERGDREKDVGQNGTGKRRGTGLEKDQEPEEMLRDARPPDKVTWDWELLAIPTPEAKNQLRELSTLL